MNVNDIKLFPHNQDTYNKIQEVWKTSNRVASVQATGTGKSYLILKCLYNEAGKNKIVLAPSNYILEQLESEVGEILPNTMLMTYAMLVYMQEEEIQKLNPSIIVLDEFHRCGAETWGEGVQRLLNSFPNAKILGTSATNIRFLDNNRDMADELFDGNVVTNLSLAEAIVKKILPMPKYVNAIYSFDNETENLKNKVNNSKNTNEEKEELLKEIDKIKNRLDKSKGIPEIFKKHLNKSNNDKFIVFCKNIEHLNEMKKIVVDWFKKARITKNIDIYTAYTGYNNTDKEVEEFKNNRKENTVKLLFSIEMFNEGIHIKDISGVILLRPTVSPIIYYQQIGRAIQVGKENTPLIFDFVNNFDNIGAKNFINDLKEYSEREREVNSGNDEEFNQDDIEFMIFDEIQNVKNMFIQIEDNLIGKESWEEMYEQLKQYLSHDSNKQIKLSNKLANWIKWQRTCYQKGTLENEKIKKFEEINFTLEIKDYDLKWDFWYNELSKYYIKNGHTNTDTNVTNGLCGWVNAQRAKYKKAKLSNKRIKKLEKLEFDFTPLNDKWEKTYQNLIEYKNEYGNCDVSQKDDRFLKLGKWVNTQRINYRNKKISKDRIEKLQKIGFTFDIDEKNWLEMFEKLKEYKNKNGDVNILKTTEDIVLYRWVSLQKRKYKTEELSKEKIKILQDLGLHFCLNMLNNKWNEMYEKLIEYKSQYGNCNVTQSYKNKKLGSWVNTQRQYYKKNKLQEDKIEKLEKVGFEWNVERNVSGVTGVSWSNSRKIWIAEIRLNNKNKRLGQRKLKIEAISLLRDAEIQYFGKSDINLDDFKDE